MSCPLSNSSLEDTNHRFMRCPTAILFLSGIHVLDHLDLKSRMMLFCISLWLIWKYRNQKVFNQTFFFILLSFLGRYHCLLRSLTLQNVTIKLDAENSDQLPLYRAPLITEIELLILDWLTIFQSWWLGNVTKWLMTLLVCLSMLVVSWKGCILDSRLAYYCNDLSSWVRSRVTEREKCAILG
jgi:hypothetical protein